MVLIVFKMRHCLLKLRVVVGHRLGNCCDGTIARLRLEFALDISSMSMESEQ